MNQQKDNHDQNIFYRELARRIGIRETENGDLGIAFMRTFTGPSVAQTMEDCFLTVPVTHASLGELYLILKAQIEKDPTKFGFEITKK